MKASSTVLCNNILYRGNRDGIRITPMKLQKLMYFVCRDYVKSYGASPISEQFEVWQYGPVLPSVYSEFKSFRSNPISGYAKDASGNVYMVREDSSPDLAMIIDNIWRKYHSFSGVDLSRITHKTESGWYRAFSERRSYITEEDMKHDFAE